MKDKNLLITEFQSKNESWGIINIYASNSRVERKGTYGKLERIMVIMKDKQIMCMGDFKTPLYYFDKLGENKESPESM